MKKFFRIVTVVQLFWQAYSWYKDRKKKRLAKKVDQAQLPPS